MALLVRKGVAQGAEVRNHGDDTLQCLVVDLKVRGLGFRVVLTHGDPSADVRVKMTHFTRVPRAATRINKEDEDAGKGALPTIWMADHNMVMDRDQDELRGTQCGKEAHALLVALVREVEQEWGGREGMLDVYRETHPEGQGFTHGVRRIDRATATTSLLSKTAPPRIEGGTHVAPEKLETAVRTPRGWEVRRPGHARRWI